MLFLEGLEREIGLKLSNRIISQGSLQMHSWFLGLLTQCCRASCYGCMYASENHGESPRQLTSIFLPITYSS